MLRLVLGGHSRAPRPYGPRLCAKHQSLHANIVTTPWNYPPASPFLAMLRLVLGGHSRAPQPDGSRPCAKHQSLHANIVTTP
jgi:hypothetical protein